MFTLKKAHRTAELLAAIAVVISLIFVGVEIGQNSQINIENSTQQILSEQRAIIRTFSEDVTFACLYVRGTNDYMNLSASEKARFSAYMSSFFGVAEDMHILMMRNRIEPEVWQGQERRMADAFELRGIKEWYATRRHWFSDSFQRYVDDLESQYPLNDDVIYSDPNCSPGNSNPIQAIN